MRKQQIHSSFQSRTENRDRQTNQETYNNSDGFPMSDKVKTSAPAIALHNLCCRSSVIHGMGRHNVVTIWGPVETQHMSRATALHNQQIQK